MQFTDNDMEFTKGEKERLNQLYGNDFKDIKPEDAKLIARWEVRSAIIDNQIATFTNEIQTQATDRLSKSQSEFEIAMANMERLSDLAVIKLKAVNDEQQK